MTVFELEAVLTLQTNDFSAEIQGAKTDMTGLQAEMTQLQTDATNTGTVMKSAFGTALGDLLSDLTEEIITAAFDFVSGSFVLASSMEEVQNVVDTTFGDSAVQINAWAKTTAQAYGVGEFAALKYSGTIGATLTGLGIGQENVYGMSTALVQLAGDMASFYNMDTDTAFQKILSGMTGEMEPLKQLGIVMSVTNLEAHALSMGIDTAWNDMDSAMQTLVRYDYLMAKTSNAQGDFTNTSGSYANQMRKLQDNITNLQLTLGEDLLPIMTDVLAFFNSLFGSAENGGEAIDGLGTTLGQTYATIETTADKALALVEALAAMEEAGVDSAKEQSVWNALLADLSSTLPGIDALIDTSTGVINGGTEALRTYAAQWRATQQEIAIANAMQSALNELTSQATKIADLQIQLQIAKMTGVDVEAKTAEYLEKAREYFGPDFEGLDNSVIAMELLDRAESGDAYASTLLTLIENLGGKDEEKARLESELLAAEAMYAEMQSKYDALEASVAALQEATSKPSEEALESGTETAVVQAAQSAAEAAFAAAAAAANVPAITVEFTANLDGSQIAATLVPKAAQAAVQTISRGVSQARYKDR